MSQKKMTGTDSPRVLVRSGPKGVTVVKIENGHNNTTAATVLEAVSRVSGVTSSPVITTATTSAMRSKAMPSTTVMVSTSPEPPSPEAEECVTSVIALEDESNEGSERVLESESPQPQQQIYIIQTTDGNVPLDSAEVVVSDEMAVYETVSALEQLSRGQVITTTENGEVIQVYEEVVLPDGGENSVDQFVDVAEVEVGDGRSASPITIGETISLSASGVVRRRTTAGPKSRTGGGGASNSSDRENSPQNEFHICRLCNQFIPLSNIAAHNLENHGTMSDLTCTDCGKIFKSKRSLFGHKKEKHSGVTEMHACPECGKTFGRKSNLKAHRESLHYGKKFPCQYCERVFTNRSSMNQHVKKTHIAVASVTIDEKGTFHI
ncbi:hypothetical protein TCAL_14545 [Tigriopus californicus]|uniref:C2H2-type domain-containing protein n=1 Tax=Tigriopus californicus TaxID=6832 RepID=A0A553PAL5_TIGCA|nr:zinc finger protein 333-like [Tigriopus californicus]TRY74722.1 hypothetical protein TCAL_14545 [Tigriopus californicus]